MSKGRAKRRTGAAKPPQKAATARRHSKPTRKRSDAQPAQNAADVYEAEERLADEDRFVYRFDDVDNYEYELPSDFEDEEIDEDEAFNSEDERKYGAWFERDAAGSTDNDAEETDDEQRGGVLTDSGSEPEDGVSQYDDEEEEEEEELKGNPGQQVDALLDDMFGADESTSDSEDDEEPDPERHAELLKAVQGRDAQLQKRDPNAHVLSEAMQEGEFNVQPEGRLRVADLIAGLGAQAGQLGSARKALERLDASAPTEAPLPAVVRDRQTRKAGYVEATRDVSKWQSIVTANREAPTLRFQDARDEAPAMTTTAALASAFEPSNPLEAEVASLLAAAHADDARAVAEAEAQLAARTLTAEELAARQSQLARMRSVLFHHERRLKRVAKIKSKDYRRRRKRAAAKAAEEGGAEDDEEAQRRAAEEAEFQRAKERLTLKHRNTSRWARRALKRGVRALDDGTKEALAEQLRLGQELRQRVNSVGRPRGSDDSDSSSEASGASDDEGEGRTAALQALLEGGVLPEDAPTKGLFSLPFMQRAMQRKQAAVRGAAEELLEEDGAHAATPSGRLRFDTTEWEGGNQSRSTSPSSDEESPHDATTTNNDDDERHADAPPARQQGSSNKRPPRHAAKLTAVNAGLLSAAMAESTTPLVMEAPQAHPASPLTPPVQPCEDCGFVPATAFAGARAGAAFKKGPLGLGYYAERAEEPSSSVPTPSNKQQPWVSAKATLPVRDDAVQGQSDEGSSDEGSSDEGSSDEDAGVVPRRQRALIQQAFAGDDVVAEFAKEKAAEVDAEHPMAETPSLLPGWGAWAGQRKTTPAWITAAQNKAAREREAAIGRRKDAKLDHVVISERWDKKAAKFTTPELPFPFKNKDAYERSIRQPLGKDFNTDSAFRNLTRPAVLKTPGVMIQPARFSKEVADELRSRPVVSKKRRVAVLAGGMPKRTKAT